MKHVAPPIGLAETARGMLVSLPPRLALAVSLRKSFRGVIPAAEPWTYLVPGKAARRLGEWIAEVELQAVTALRRRAWTADDAEWSGTPRPAAIASPAAEPAIVVLPKTRTARPVLELLQRMATGEILTAAVGGDGRTFRLSPSGRRVAPVIAARAIGDRLLVPSCDGLFGPDWSQTWRSPTKEELDAAEHLCRADRPARRPRRPKDCAEPLPRPVSRRPAANPRARRPIGGAADGAGPARARRAKGVAEPAREQA